MGIRKRPATDLAAIDRFGDAADAPSTPALLPASPASTTQEVAEPAAKTSGVAKSSTGTARKWPSGVGRTLLVRWPDPALAKELAEVAALEDRSQHKTALRALQRGLEAIRAEHESDR
ncbi:hypothetical protein C5C18_12005 [Rathayibacter tritici]|uniref:hypothetical protein n=1 Tax=Rathayibacter tritici TaxID=33888 RepID=UPI000CE8FBCC|nr:hypothetical protein [Rathayibacter tritici]PPF66137.1 hypothetical protein C5C21_09590 [Rathayibacter tritici]PPG05998.1 hypothetical protein C5C18_12005 [Rathayibacter tritici]